MTTYTNADENSKDFGGMTLLVRPDFASDEETVVGYEYCVAYGEGKETDWINGNTTEAQAFERAQDWAVEIANSECEDALKDKSTEPYAWMIENIDGFADYSDDSVETLVKQQAQASYDFGIADWVSGALTFDEFLKVSDYQYALKAVLAYRDEQRTLRQLDTVVTPSEVADELDIKEDTVRDACQNGWITARKSGKTWLILRSDATARWERR